MSELLRGAIAHYSSVIDGNPSEPEMLEREFVLELHQSTFVDIPELRRRIVAVFCQHHQVLHRRTSRNGIRAFARALTFEHFALLGLHPHLWSLSRGLGQRLDEYQSATAMNDPMQTDGLEGAQQLTDREQLAFIDFMLDVCHEEVDYVTTALNRRRLRESITRAYKTNSRLKDSGIRPETMPALLALLIQGALPRSEFVSFTGLPAEAASDQLSKLIIIGVIVSPPSNLHGLEIGLPVWFAQEFFSGLQ
ncbi:Fic family protein [Pseudomonas sp. PB3P13]